MLPTTALSVDLVLNKPTLFLISESAVFSLILSCVLLLLFRVCFPHGLQMIEIDRSPKESEDISSGLFEAPCPPRSPVSDRGEMASTHQLASRPTPQVA